MELILLRVLVHICCAPCFTYVHNALKDEGVDFTGFFYNPNIHPYLEYLKRLHCLERYTVLRPVDVIYDKEYNLDKYLVRSLEAKYDPPPELLLDKIPTKSKKQNTQNGFKEEIKMKESLQIKLTPKDSDHGSKTTIDLKETDSEIASLETSIVSNQKSDPDFNTRCGYCIKLRLDKTAEAASEQGFDAFTTTLLESRYQPHNYIRFIGETIANEKDLIFYYQDFRKGWKESIAISKELELYRQSYCGCIFSEYERYGPEQQQSDK